MSDEPVITLVNTSTGARFDFRGKWLRSSPATERDVRMGAPSSAATRCG